MKVTNYLTTYQHERTGPTKFFNSIFLACELEEWKGDGICDDATNNEACEWDGGDCCDDNANTNTSNECYEGNLRQF